MQSNKRLSVEILIKGEYPFGSEIIQSTQAQKPKLAVVYRSNNNANANGGVSYANANNGSSNANSNIGVRLANHRTQFYNIILE